MYYGIYYITSKQGAIKLFTGITQNDLCVLDMLRKQDKPCHYRRLYDLLHKEGNLLAPNTFADILRKSVDKGLITRLHSSGNVVYSITLAGKKLLIEFAHALDNKVNEQIQLFGNGLNT